MSENTSESETQPYVDPNSGAAPQPGGFVAGAIPQEAQADEKSTTDAGQDGADETEETQPESGGEQPTGEEQGGEQPSEEQKDYSELLSKGVDEVNEYIEQNPEERDAVVQAEQAGKNRKGITGG